MVLHDSMKPSSSEPPQRSSPKLCNVAVVSGSGSSVRNGNCLLTSTWSVSAVAALTVLNVEPGGYSSRHARASIGLSGAARRNSRASRATFVSCDTSSVGSYVGFEYAATTPPVRTLSTTTEPRRPASPSAAACWARTDRFRKTVPVIGRFATQRLGSLSENLQSRPASCFEYSASTPVDPNSIDW